MVEGIRKLLKNLPRVDEVLANLEQESLYARTPRNLVLNAVRSVIAEIRENILAASRAAGDLPALPDMEEIAGNVLRRMEELHTFSLRPVINATGIILHTNLGRAPLCRAALERIIEVSAGYSNLEFDLRQGKRGMRYDHVRDLICSLAGAEEAIVVNNNAAAVLLVLNTLAEGREAIVSRGELVEIGGAFRIPEVMQKSGVCLREVGTTNRTRLSDYEEAINERTALILKVHTSNYRIVGFTEEVALASLVGLGKKRHLPVMNDLGSGCFIDLSRYGFEKEPTVQESLKAGVDVVTFSGDKLLGGPQAGIILGARTVLEQIKKNPLNRALRIDKMTLAALEATMKQYLDVEKAISAIRSLRSMTEPLPSVAARAENLLTKLKNSLPGDVTISLKAGDSMVGGGALPAQTFPTALVSLRSVRFSTARIERALRMLDIPVIARIAEDEVLFDLRTVTDQEVARLEQGIGKVFASLYKA